MSKVEETKEMITIHRSYLYTMKENAEKWKEPAMVLTDNMIHDYEKLYTLIKEVEAEQEELQKKADKYDELMRLAVATNTPIMTEKLDKLLNELDDPEKFDQFIDDYHAFVDKDKPVEVPPEFDEWYKNHHKPDRDEDLIYDFIQDLNDDVITEKLIKFYEDSGDQFYFALMKGNYTVKQEQLYYLVDKNTDQRMYKRSDGSLKWVNGWAPEPGYWFNKSEIAAEYEPFKVLTEEAKE